MWSTLLDKLNGTWINQLVCIVGLIVFVLVHDGVQTGDVINALIAVAVANVASGAVTAVTQHITSAQVAKAQASAPAPAPVVAVAGDPAAGA